MRRGRSAYSLMLCAVFAALLGGCAREVDPVEGIASARSLIEEGEAGEARVRLKNLVIAHPDLQQARVLLAEIALSAGDPQAADDELASIDRKLLVDAEGQHVRYRTDLALGRSDDVLAALSGDGLKLSQRDRVLLRSAALRNKGTAADAIEDLRNAIAVTPDDPALTVELSECLAAIGNLQAAQQTLDEFLKRQPKSAEALLARGELRLRKGEAVAAEGDLRGAISSAAPAWPQTSRIAAETLIGEALLAAGKLDEAKAQIATIDKLFPGVIGAQLLGARIALLEGRNGDAVDVLQRVYDAIPDNARIQYLLADALVRSGNLTRATELLAKRVRSAPEDMLARRFLARLMLEQSRPDQVIELLGSTSPATDGVDPESDGLLSAARLAQEKAGEAIETLTARVAADPGDDALRAQLAAEYFRNGDPRRALSTLQQRVAAKLWPQAAAVEIGAHRALGQDRELNLVIQRLVSDPALGPDVLLAAADAAQRSGRPDAAGGLVDRVLQRQPDLADALLRKASIAFTERRFDEARSTLRRLIEKHPQDPYARLALARVAEAQGDAQRAREELQQAVDSKPAALEPALMLAGLELRADQPQAATRVLDRLVTAAPADGAAANAAGLLLLGNRRIDEARTRFRTAVEQKDSVAEYWFNLGRTQIAVDDRGAARQSFARAVAARPDWLDANVAAIRLALFAKDAGAALELARKLADRMPGNPVAWLMIGEVHATETRFSDASSAFSKSFAQQPTVAAAIGDHLARRSGGLARPDLPLINWLALDPRDVVARRRLADFYLVTGAAVEAIKQFEKLIQIAPNDVSALNNLAWLLATRDVPRAEVLARRAYSISPQNAAVADTLGWVLVQASKFAEARDLLSRSADGLPEDRGVRYRYALALARSGDRSAARQQVERALAGAAPFDARTAAQSLAEELSR